MYEIAMARYRRHQAGGQQTQAFTYVSQLKLWLFRQRKRQKETEHGIRGRIFYSLFPAGGGLRSELYRFQQVEP